MYDSFVVISASHRIEAFSKAFLALNFTDKFLRERQKYLA